MDGECGPKSELILGQIERAISANHAQWISTNADLRPGRRVSQIHQALGNGRYSSHLRAREQFGATTSLVMRLT